MSNHTIGKKYPPEAQAAIRENLRLLRKYQGISRKSAAKAALVSESTLYKLELGDSSSVSVWRLFDVCVFYRVPPHTILIEGYYANPCNIPPR